MKNRSFVILIAALAVLVLVYVVQQLNTGHKTISETMVKIFSDVDSAVVTYIRAYKVDYPDSGIGFAKKDTSWVVSSYYNAPGKNSNIEKIISDVKKLDGEIRSNDEALLGDYGLGDKEALHIEFLKSDSSMMQHFLVGKGLQDAPRSSFIRKQGDNTVYKVNENIMSRFAMFNAEPAKRIQVNRWIELKMANVVADSVKSLNLDIKGKTYSFAKEKETPTDTMTPPKTTWKQVEPTKGKILENNDISGIVNRLSGLGGSDIASPDIKPSSGLDKPSYSATLLTEDGRKLAFQFGALTDTTSKSRYAIVQGNPFIFKVQNYSFESIFVTPFAPPKKEEKKK